MNKIKINKNAEKERVKELTALYKVSDVLAKSRNLKTDVLIYKIVKIIPSAYRYSKYVCARLCIDGQKVGTSNFKQTAWKQACDITIDEEKAGYIEVYYLKRMSEADIGPFLKEEKSFLDELARMFSINIEKRKFEKQIIHLNKVLHAICNVNQIIIKEKNPDELLTKVCKELVKTKGYYNAWIILFDKAEESIRTAEAGIGEKFNLVINLFKKGKKIVCIRKALKSEDVITINNPNITCKNCPLLGKNKDFSAMSMRLRHGERTYGVLTIALPREFHMSIDEESLVKEIAGDLAFALHKMELDEAKKKTGEKLKESEERYRLIYETSSDAIMTLEPPDWRFTSGNQAMLKLFGVKNEKEFILSKPWQMSPKYQPDGELSSVKAKKMIALAMKNGEAFFEWIHKKVNGGDFFATVLLNKVELRGKVFLQVRVSDITERKKATILQLKDAQKLERALLQLIEVSTQTVEKRDPYTSGHQKRVALLAQAIAKEIHLTEIQIKTLYLAGLIHDIGKVAIPSEILSRPGVLSNEELELVKTHTQVGYDIIKNVDFPWPLSKLVLLHHERLDGSGYPKGLIGKQIDILCRILSVADVVEAMLSHRPYRPALGLEAALKEIRAGKNKLYDPDVVNACIRLFKKRGFKFKRDNTKDCQTPNTSI